MRIYQVTNLQTKVADGTLTRGRNTEVEGSYIKVTGDNPAVGIYLESTDEAGTSYKPDAGLIVVNNSGKLLNVPRQVVFGRLRRP
jgi:hypothetical protein